MATFIKGSAVITDVNGNFATPTAYKLFKKNGDAYEEIAIQEVTGSLSTDFPHEGVIGEDGRITTDISYSKSFKTSNFIPVVALINVYDPETGFSDYCVDVMYHEAVDYNLAGFYSEASEDTFISGLTYDELTNLHREHHQIKEYAKSIGAKYVRFSSIYASTYTPWVGLINDISFCLDDYKDKLHAGETYQLVVQAIGEGGQDLDGDGVIYADSDYSLPVEYQKGSTIWYVDNRANIEKVKTDANIAGRGWSLIASNPAYNAIIGRPINTWGFFTNKANQNLTIMKLASKGATTGEVIATVTATPVDGFAVVKFPTVTLKDGEYLSIGSDANEDIHMYYTTTSITDANGLVDIGFHSRVPKVYGTGSAWTEYISGTFAWSFGYTSD